MRTSIFTDKERQTINDYLNGKPVNNIFWGVLKHRIKKYNHDIQADFDLMKKVLTSIGEVSEKEKTK